MPSLILKNNQPFSLDLTLSCGQVFRWERETDGWWKGIVGDRAIRIRQDGAKLTWEGAPRTFIEHYFSLDHLLPAITASFDRDPFIHTAIDRCQGLRLIRQPPWECLISYICATNSNIPMIRRRIRHIAERFGAPLPSPGPAGYAFPTATSLAGNCLTALSACKMGYRGPYVQKTACSIGDENEWEKSIRALPVAEARKFVMQFQGVGPKAADCILLFAFQKYETFPVDVWIRRIMREHYIPSLPGNGSLTTREYDLIRRFGRKHFGMYCGYAQEYLYAAREG